MKFKFLLLLALIIVPNVYGQNTNQQEYDIVVYGGTSGGVIAAYSAKKLGKTVLLIEPEKYLGGMTSGGLGSTDIGNKSAITGLSRAFYRDIGKHYNHFEQWRFEPHVAENQYLAYIKKENIPVLYQSRIISAKKVNGVLQEITLEKSYKPDAASNKSIKAKMFIDCSYEGDLLAKAGVSYFVGREDNQQYKETLSGFQIRQYHQFPDGVDPYKIPGDPKSGLIYGISDAKVQPVGTGDKYPQAYNFRMTLTNVAANRLDIAKPANYVADNYELLARHIAKKPWKSISEGFKLDMMPNGKTDSNNEGAFSTDFIGENFGYPEGTYQERAKIWQKHKEYIQGFFYFLGHDKRVPEYLRTEMLNWGLAKDEFKDNGNWPYQLYVREARRMIGEYVMTQHNCERREVVKDGIGMAAYTMDSHNVQRLVVNGMVKNEGDVQVGGFPPYPISYRSIVPKEAECKNLLVPVCMSASHIAYGSIRMEPVFMVLGQSAAVAAAMAIDGKSSVQKLDVTKLQQKLQSDPYLDGTLPEVLVDNSDAESVTITGDWTKTKKGGHNGPDFLMDAGSDAASVRFKPKFSTSGKYKVFMYSPHMGANELAEKVNVKIQSEGAQEEMSVEVKSSMNDWCVLGEFAFKAGREGYVEISKVPEMKGAAAADALLFVPIAAKRGK